MVVPDEPSDEIHAVSKLVTYGWGVIPAQVSIGTTSWRTSLIPRDGRYLVPLKASIRKAESIDEGDTVAVTLEIDLQTSGDDA